MDVVINSQNNTSIKNNNHNSRKLIKMEEDGIELKKPMDYDEKQAWEKCVERWRWEKGLEKPKKERVQDAQDILDSCNGQNGGIKK